MRAISSIFGGAIGAALSAAPVAWSFYSGWADLPYWHPYAAGFAEASFVFVFLVAAGEISGGPIFLTAAVFAMACAASGVIFSFVSVFGALAHRMFA